MIVPVSGKKGQAHGGGAVLHLFFSVQGFMDVLEWVSMKDGATQELSAHHFAVQGPKLS